MDERPDGRSRDELLEEIRELKARLSESERTLQAITNGEIDALVVNIPKGKTIYTLEGADKPYRILVEQMHEGAVTLGEDGLILYANKRVADMLKVPLEMIIGQQLDEYILPLDRSFFRAMLKRSDLEVTGGRISIIADDGTLVPVMVSVSKLRSGDFETHALILSEMTEIVKAEESLREMNDELELRVAERTSSLERTNELLKAEVIERIIIQRQLAEEKERIAALLSCIGDALIATDDREQIVMINHTGEKITGWSSAEAHGKKLQEVFATEHEDIENGEACNEPNENGKYAVLHTARLRTKVGSQVHVEYGASPLRGDDRKRGMIVVFRLLEGERS